MQSEELHPGHPDEPAESGPQAEIILRVADAGEWMEPAEMRRLAMSYLQADSSPTRRLVLDFGGLDHLDASALQVLLAVCAEQHNRGGVLATAHVSEELRKWFEYAGAADWLGCVEKDSPAVTEESPLCEQF